MIKILVIRLSSLGDIILTTPLLKTIKQIYPGSLVDYCTKADYSEIIRNNPNIDNIIETENDLTFPKLRILKKKLKNEKYDLIVDLHNKLSTFYLRTFLTGKKMVLKKHSIRKFLLVNFKINLMRNLPPIIGRYINVIPGANYDGKLLPEIYSDQNIIKKIEGLSDFTNKITICIVPSSKHYTKTYPAELYTELINSLDRNKYCFVLIGKGKDKEITDSIKSYTGNNVYDFCDKLNVGEIFELMKKCRLVISGDTGPMHIAEAAGVPIILLAGSSVREFGFYPQVKNAVILENNKLRCRPCSHIGRDSCPKGHFKCMHDIKPAEIKNAVESLLLIQ